MQNQKPPAKNPTHQATLPGLTPSPINPTPFPVGVPLDILDTTVRKIFELMSPLVKTGLPITLPQILRDAIVNAYQRGKAEERAEANLLMESMEKINDRRHERLTELVIAQCMDALGLSSLTLDLSKSIDGKVTAHLDAAQRHIVVYTYEEPDHE